MLLSFHLRLRLTLFAVPQYTVAQNLNNYHQIGFFGMLMVPIVQIHYQTVSLSCWIGGQTVIFTICSEMDGKNGKNIEEIYYVAELSDEMQGIIVHRTFHHVRMNINKMEGAYKKASDWVNQIGQGELDEEGDIQGITI